MYFFSKLSKSIWFINTSRGQIVNTKSLLNAIDSGIVLGACLDVLEWENHSFENIENMLSHPDDILKRVINHPQILLTPHVAGWTFESNKKHAEILWKKLKNLKLV